MLTLQICPCQHITYCLPVTASNAQPLCSPCHVGYIPSHGKKDCTRLRVAEFDPSGRISLKYCTTPYDLVCEGAIRRVVTLIT